MNYYHTIATPMIERNNKIIGVKLQVNVVVCRETVFTVFLDEAPILNIALIEEQIKKGCRNSYCPSAVTAKDKRSALSLGWGTIKSF